MPEVTYRFATDKDVPVILALIKRLAEYEKAADQVVATEESLHQTLFEQHFAEVLLACADGKEVGFALFFHNYSTWLGRPGIFLEDLFVVSEERGKGYGKGLLRQLARIAVERGCGRLEWNCLNWNLPSIDFYLSLGAEQMDEWTTYRLEGATLQALAQPNAAADPS